VGLRSSIDQIAESLAQELGARIEGLRQLSGGASRETWAFEADGRPLILQRLQSSRDDMRIGLTQQVSVLKAAHAAGVHVPVVRATSEGGSLGEAIIVERIDGETIPRKILRDEVFAKAREGLGTRCGEELARIHSIPLDAVGSLEQKDPLAVCREILDGSGHPHPAFELAFRWLERERPAGSSSSVVHGDFRLGNLIVGPEGLRAIIDWELAHIGDPMEDLGWLCVKSWRFGGVLPVGGFGSQEDLIASYEKVSGRSVDPNVVGWWEVAGTLRWGVICIAQAMRHLSGDERSVELATIGRRVAEVEHDLMLLLP